MDINYASQICVNVKDHQPEKRHLQLVRLYSTQSQKISKDFYKSANKLLKGMHFLTFGFLVVGVPVVVVVACFIFLRWVECKLVFRIPRNKPLFEDAALTLKNTVENIEARQATLAGKMWLMWIMFHQVRYFINRKPSHKGIVVVFHGNACVASDMVEFVRQAEKANMACALVEYPGYADQSQRLMQVTQVTQYEVLENCLLAFDHIVKNNTRLAQRVVVVGQSLGTCVATYVASEREVHRLVLVSCFPSISHVANIPALGFLLKNNFKASQWAPHVKAQVFIVQGQLDKLVPMNLCLEQAKNFPNSDTRNVHVVQHADHNNITKQGAFWVLFESFIRMAP